MHYASHWATIGVDFVHNIAELVCIDLNVFIDSLNCCPYLHNNHHNLRENYNLFAFIYFKQVKTIQRIRNCFQILIYMWPNNKFLHKILIF